jgi:AcrR family transcriptional regulator
LPSPASAAAAASVAGKAKFIAGWHHNAADHGQLDKKIRHRHMKLKLASLISMNVVDEPSWRHRRRRNILLAAAAQFSARAFDQVQMDDIARAAGVGKATLYRYFASKEDLYLESFDEVLTALDQRLAAAAAAPVPPAEQLARMIEALVETLSEQLASLRLLTGSEPSLAERWRAVLRQHRQRITDALRDALRRGVLSGEFRDLDLDIVPGMLIGMIRGGLMGAGEVPRRQLGDAALDLVLHGSLAGVAHSGTAAPSAAE